MTPLDQPWLKEPLSQLGIRVVPSLNAPPDSAYLIDNSTTLVVHPTTYIWLEHSDEPEIAHHLVMAWIYSRIELMAEAANARLDRMVAEMDAGTWGKKVVGVVAEGPLAGSLAYRNDDGTYTAGRGRTIENDAFLTHSKYFLPVISKSPVVGVSVA